MWNASHGVIEKIENSSLDYIRTNHIMEDAAALHQCISGMRRMDCHSTYNWKDLMSDISTFYHEMNETLKFGERSLSYNASIAPGIQPKLQMILPQTRSDAMRESSSSSSSSTTPSTFLTATRSLTTARKTIDEKSPPLPPTNMTDQDTNATKINSKKSTTATLGSETRVTKKSMKGAKKKVQMFPKDGDKVC